MKTFEQVLKSLDPYMIFFCSGARNASLLEACQKYPIEFMVDERMAAFRALGVAKKTKKPVVICTTSGTAVAECLPAIIEAYYSGEQIIVVSADRPERLHGTNAPQTIIQGEVLKPFCRFLYHGKLDDIEILNFDYPMHLNIFIDHREKTYTGSVKDIGVEDFKALVHNAKFPIALFTESNENFDVELRALNELNFPIYREASYQGENIEIFNEIKYEKELLQDLDDNKIDLVLKFGKTPFSKLWRVLDDPEKKVQIVSYKNKMIGLPYGVVLNEDLPSLEKRELNYESQTCLNSLLEEFPESEFGIFQQISHYIKSDDLVYVGNSMPIRYWQMLRRFDVKTYCSRGANGIDGQLSTALGLAYNTDEKVHCILGDLTFLYDLSSLYYEWPQNFQLYVVNNSGGRIFERVKVPKELVLEHTNKFSELFRFFDKEQQALEFIPNQDQTRNFWQAWDSK